MIIRNIKAFLFCILVVFPLTILLFDRQPPVSWQLARTNPTPVVSGELMSITWSVKSYRRCPGTFIRTIIDSTGHEFNYTAIPILEFDRGKHTVVGPEFQLPKGIASGPAQYKGIARFNCNFMQELFWPIYYELSIFTIVVK